MFETYLALLKRDLTLAMRRRTDIMSALFFFVVVVSLFPLGIGPEMKTLQLIAPGVLWVAALLASMLALENLFSNDYNDGSLEQMLLVPQPLSVLVFAKITAHWLITGLPLVLISPILGIQYNLSGETLWVLIQTLLIGTPALSLIGGIGAALTLGLRGGGILVSLLVLPLTIPVLIFGAGAVEATASGLGGMGHIYLLTAILIMSLVLAPIAASAALRISIE